MKASLIGAVCRAVRAESVSKAGEVDLPQFVTVSVPDRYYEERVNSLLEFGPLLIEFFGRLVCLKNNGEAIYEIYQ